MSIALILPAAALCVNVLTLLVVVFIFFKHNQGQNNQNAGMFLSLEELIKKLQISSEGKLETQARDIRDIQTKLATSVASLQTTQAKSLHEISEASSNNMLQLREALEEKNKANTKEYTNLLHGIEKAQERNRTAHAQSLKEISQHFYKQMDEVKTSVTQQLNQAVEKQMERSFQRVSEHMKNIQQAMGEIRQMTSQVGDLKRLFSNVKARGGWGEAQLQTILDDILPPGAWKHNVRIGEGNNIVEFAIHIPVRRDQAPLLPIDSKFPTESYERLLQADETGDQKALAQARKELRRTVTLEAQKISEKYIHRPQTVDYAIMYVPTDSLYMEITRIPGLIDEIGRKYNIYVMGPVLMAALLRTVHLGYVNVALDEHTQTIAKLLAQTQQEMVKMDDVLEKLSKQTQTVSNSIGRARQRTRVLRKKLNAGASTIQQVAHIDPQEDNEPAEIEEDT